MARFDISPQVIHFTKGRDDEDAFGNLCSILEAGEIFGAEGNIRGGFTCVCFTEAPLAALGEGLVNDVAYSKYSAFGVMFDKRHIFALGGRPVIYQSGVEYDALPEELRWRHMRYEPDQEDVVDFTWEREWRVPAGSVQISAEVAGIVVPDDAWAQRLIEAHTEQQDWQVWQYSQIMDSTIAQQYREDFNWQLYTLR